MRDPARQTAHVYAFTRAGAQLAEHICTCLEDAGWMATGYAPQAYRESLDKVECRQGSLTECVGVSFADANCIVFVGATGIAVRAIAPYVSDKKHDPAVICTDEKGMNVISLLSGHIGGANTICRRIATYLKGNAVITTATDVNDTFAVDEWAHNQGMAIGDYDIARKMAARILCGETIGLRSDWPVEGTLPAAIDLNADQCGIYISLNEKNKPFPITLNLIPRIVAVGVGCRRRASADDIVKSIEDVLRESDISTLSIKGLYSVDLKKDEAGLIEAARRFGVPFLTYTADELNKAAGSFTESKFVREVTGTGAVCERAASLGASGGMQLVGKTVRRSVTIAVYTTAFSAKFDMEDI